MRWIIPKGWPMKGKTSYAAAAQEAREEAGITGKIASTPIGRYRYAKRIDQRVAIDCVVEVFPLEVLGQRKRWREQHQRTATWFGVAEAAAAVEEPELRGLIEALAQAVRPVDL
jgi:8-oxo-dGTP pyrophosphatase MutT (NUDIX family)